MSFALGFAAIAYIAIAFPNILLQIDDLPFWWSASAIISFFGAALALGACAWFASVHTLTILASISALAYLAGLLTIVPSLGDTRLSESDGSPWIVVVSVLAVSAAASAWRPSAVWGYLFVVIALQVGVRNLATEGDHLQVSLQDAVMTVMFDAVFAALALATVRAGRQLDEAASEAATAAAQASASRAQTRERERVQALVHDHVLVALVASSRWLSLTRQHASRHARTALGKIEEYGRGDLRGAFAPRELIWELQATCTEISPRAEFSFDDASKCELEVPYHAGQALMEATAEALRNSVRHAGDDSVARAVHANITGSHVEVHVIDTGQGFDVMNLPPARLGIAVSIQRRIASVGGQAVITSTPGAGTIVSLSWSAS